MKKKVILILIQIFVVAIALALTVTTYAWFVSQTRVEVTQTTVTAAAGANTFIENEEEFEYIPYKGETGQGYPFDEHDGVDRPYIVEKKLTVTFNPLGNDSAMTAKILSMKIARTTGESISSEGTPEILDYFTWRVVIDEVEYGPDRNGFLCREVVIEDADEVEDNGGNVDGEDLSGDGEGGSGDGNESGESESKIRYEYYEVGESVTVDVTFKLIFLDEESYVYWLNGEYEFVEPFAYCGYENMRATFTCVFEIGIDAKITESGGVDA